MKRDGKCGGLERERRFRRMNPIGEDELLHLDPGAEAAAAALLCLYIQDADAPTASLPLTFLHVWRDAAKTFAQKEEKKCHSQFQFDVL